MRARLGTSSDHANPSSDFDPEFYLRKYRDLAEVGDAQALYAHFRAHGRKEGRFSNPHAMIRALETHFEPLPDDFIPQAYRALHADLRGMLDAWELQEHYLLFGRSEKRGYTVDLTDGEWAFARLRAGGDGTASDLVRLDAFPSFASLLAHARVAPGAWLDRFVLYDFALLNADWLPRTPASRMEGIALFLLQGIERLAPVSLHMRFDPDFYRAGKPSAYACRSDADLYRLWLGGNAAEDEPGTEAAALVRLLGQEQFPESFDEVTYRASLPETVPPPDPGRFEALRHFVTTGFALWELEDVRLACAPRLLAQIGEHHLDRGDAVIAKEAYDRALRAGDASGHLRHRLGDALRMLGRQGEATRAFAAAADTPGAIAWSRVHVLDGLSARPEGIAEALARVEHEAEWCSASPHWRAAAHRVLGRTFAAASEEARNLYAAGLRREADARLTACLDRIADLIGRADPFPGALPVPTDGPIVILANRDLPQCEHYRVAQKVQQLVHGGWRVEVFGQSEANDARVAIDRAAAVVFYRVAAFPEVLHAILYARALGLPTIYEIDDLIFDPDLFPDPLASYEGQITPDHYVELQYGVPLFRYAMRACETGLASTLALAERMRPLVRSGVCHVLRNGMDARNIPFLARPHRPFSEARLTIFYGSGTRAHNRDFNELAAPALRDVLARHPHIRLVIAGYLRLDDAFRPLARQVVQLGFTADVAAYWEVLSGADISLAVLAPGAFADAKSEIKWLEAAMCGVPSIVSATRTHREILVDGRDALLAETAGDWAQALDALVADPARRRAIGAAARAKALAAYSLDAAIGALRQVLSPPHRQGTGHVAAQGIEPSVPIMARPAGVRAGRPRVLVVNVFFPPQTVGGATRVVRDNVDHILDQAGDRFEIAVAACDLDAETPYVTRIDSYRGLPVLRIATPRAADMDWRPFDPEVRPGFEALLERFAPDLVHFHCVQRLTASVVEAVQARSIPHIVTLHDGWWISDFQFLTDEDGQVQRPSGDLLADATGRGLNPTASLARRRGLARVLESATALVAVSETFADLYRAAGFPRTIAIPNGLPDIALSTASLVRRADSRGRVRLGHIGGRAAHKGATLVEAVLRASGFANLSLLLVDHALATDHAIEETWGATPVRIVGKVAQERIGELYAELDVLLAPSLWPESFGLVTREARAAGLWVVASDRGAIGEEVRDGVDGLRIDVGSEEGLTRALARIDADPARFCEPPPVAPRPVRTAADQGDDLLALYDQLVAAPR